MQSQYYIDAGGTKDGPHDLVTLMRRIRAKKIGPDTLISVDDAPATPASQVPDLSMFFNQNSESQATDSSRLLTLRGIIHEGWQFTVEHNIMTVFSGGITLMCLLVAAYFIDVLNVILGGILSVIIVFMAHYIYMVFVLRLYRGQPISADFMGRQLSETAPLLFFAAVSIALMTAGGFLLLVIPAFLINLYYVFVPFLMLDRKMNLVEAMSASRLLVNKHNHRYRRLIALLMLAYLGSMMLIIPIPLTMPMFAAALVKIYEELSFS